MDEFYRLRRVTGERYDIFDKQFIRIVNMYQACFYISQSVELWDCYPSVDKNGKPIAIFVFKREDTKDAYDTWCKQKEAKYD